LLNALSIDLEDWFHPELIKRSLVGTPKSQVLRSTEPILQLLDQYRVRATFFVLGDVARVHPDLIRRLQGEGHEIASHGMTHRPLWDLDQEAFEEELTQFRELIDGILTPGTEIAGFRAPTFSLDNRTRYAIPSLAAHGYQYDTSIFPVKNYMYGVAGAPLTVYRPDPEQLERPKGDGPIQEFPMTVWELGGVRIPVSGGFYLRLMPYPLLRRLLRSVNRSRPFVIYIHPWETFVGTPRVKGIGWKNAFITYFGCRGALGKFERLLKDFRFAPIIEVLRDGSRLGN
jgi:polysaccharide deacetylase family protein (PEP-CTERM system associated)